jgi:photosystem II stability/assembly factor-like uncharacterized protein
MPARFARILSLSTRLLAATCGAAIAASALPGCLGRCVDLETRLELSREPTPTTATLRGVVAVGGGAIAVGDGGVLLVRGAAAAWAALASGTDVDLHAVASNGDVAVAVGAGGTVVRGGVDGRGWAAIDTGAAATLRGVAFGGGVVIAVGDEVVLRSDDGGETWVPAEVPATTAGLRAVAAGPDGWLAVGERGRALRSGDDGRTWTEAATPSAADLVAVAVADGSGGAWVVAAADGTVLRGGATAMDFVEVADPVELHGLSRDGEWLVGADGAVRRLEYGLAFDSYTWAADDVEGARLLAVAAAADLVLAVGEGGAVVAATLTAEETGTHLCRTDVIEGRPFVVDDEARTAAACERDDWCDAVQVAALPAATRARLAAAWTRDGLYEHASVASFARFVLQLLAASAPPELVLAGQAALADEVRHARACFGLASAYAGAPVGPGPLAIDGALAGPADLAALAGATAVEGCVNETIAALVATTAAGLATDPAVRSRLATIAADERRHAALAWRTVAWALARGGAEVRAAVARAFAREPEVDADAGEDGLADHGRLSRRARVAVTRVAWRDIVAPHAAALLASDSRATMAA